MVSSHASWLHRPSAIPALGPWNRSWLAVLTQIRGAALAAGRDFLCHQKSSMKKLGGSPGSTIQPAGRKPWKSPLDAARWILNEWLLSWDLLTGKPWKTPD